MDILQIINEEINKYIGNIVNENETPKNKLTQTQKKANSRDGQNVSSGDENQLRHDVNNADLINIAALAREIYPDHTPQGAQSQLRKKLKGVKNDNGSEYHIKKREARIIRQALNDI